jgi:YARHG domain
MHDLLAALRDGQEYRLDPHAYEESHMSPAKMREEEIAQQNKLAAETALQQQRYDLVRNLQDQEDRLKRAQMADPRSMRPAWMQRDQTAVIEARKALQLWDEAHPKLQATTDPNQSVAPRALPVGPSSGQVNQAKDVNIGSQTDKAALPGERYPQTRQRLLTLENIKGLSAAEVRYAINEIYARYGATFSNHPDVQRQFQKFDWYHPKPKLTFEDIDQSMSDIERENVKVLAQYRAMTSLRP